MSNEVEKITVVTYKPLSGASTEKNILLIEPTKAVSGVSF